MGKLQQSDKGFGAIELILILVIVGILGFVGWFVYNTKQKNDTILKAASQTNNSTPPKLSKTTAKSATTNQTIVKFPELGVEVTVPDSIKDLTYVIENRTDPNGKPVVYARVTTTSLVALDANCTAASSALGVIGKGTGTYPAQAGSAFETYGSLQKQFSGFFISYDKSHAACSESTSTQAVQSTQTQMLTTALSTVKLIQ